MNESLDVRVAMSHRTPPSPRGGAHAHDDQSKRTAPQTRQKRHTTLRTAYVDLPPRKTPPSRSIYSRVRGRASTHHTHHNLEPDIALPLTVAHPRLLFEGHTAYKREKGEERPRKKIMCVVEVVSSWHAERHRPCRQSSADPHRAATAAAKVHYDNRREGSTSHA